MSREVLHTLALVAIPILLLALTLVEFYRVPPEVRVTAPVFDRQAIKAVAREAIVEAGLAGEALDRKMEGAIVAFMKSRAGEPDAKPTAAPEPAPSPTANVEPLNPTAEPIAGNPKVHYQLIVYSDYECPFCKYFDSTLKSVIERYGKRLAIGLRDYPLQFHGETAVREAVAAQCAFKLGGNAAFWPYSHGIFERTGSNGEGLAPGGLSDLAVEVGLDRAAFQACLASPGSIRAGIDADRDSGNAAGVRGTPISVLLDTRTGKSALLRGAQPLSAIISALDGLLRQAVQGGKMSASFPAEPLPR